MCRLGARRSFHSLLRPRSLIQSLIANTISEFERLGITATEVAQNGLEQTLKSKSISTNDLTKDLVTFELIKIPVSNSRNTGSTLLGGNESLRQHDDGGFISVLAPKIYLGIDTRNRLITNNQIASDATIFAKDNITITSGNITSSGSITSGNNLSLTSLDNITLTNATLQSTNKTSLNALGNINISGNLAKLNTISVPSAVQKSSLSSTKSFSTSSTTSPILFSTSSTTATDLKDDASTSRSAAIFNAGTDIEINSSSNINISNNYFQSGGSIFMTATNNINNSNYQIKADENVVMEANNINNIHTISTSSSASGSPCLGGSSSCVSTVMGVNNTIIEAGKMVSINAVKDSEGEGGNITNIGATIKGGELVYLTADNNITNKALIEYNINGNKIRGQFTN
jgi:hypothetical protein